MREQKNLMPFIYRYRDPVHYLADYLAWSKNLDETFTVRKWAHQMGVNDVDSLVSILKKKKKIKSRHFQFLKKGIRLDDSEFIYFQLLIQLENAETEEDRKMYEVLLTEHSGPHQKQVIRNEDPEIFSSWINMAILSLCNIQRTKVTRDSLSRIFIPDLSASELIDSVELLKKHELIVETELGQLQSTGKSVTGWTNQKNMGAREYYKQVSELAKNAVQLDINSREFQCFSLELDRAKVPQMKELIRNFRKTLSSMADDQANEVYQINLQLFPVTQLENNSVD